MGAFMNSSAAMLAMVIPSDVIWSYTVFALVCVAGVATLFLRGDWQTARGIDKLILFGPIFYAAPLGGFGTEHFTQAAGIASIVPKFIPWHMFWALFIGACFIAASFSLVTRIQARLAATLVGLTFFLFVMLMDAPGWALHPGNRFFAILTLRELSFSGGALAYAAFLAEQEGGDGSHILATIARYFVGVPILFYSFQQFMHGDHVPGVPLEPLTPTYIWGHAIWGYVAAIGYLFAGILLLVGKKTRPAATLAALTVLLIELVVYLPIAVVQRASLDLGFNYMADTLMFCGAVFLLAGAMPREEAPHAQLTTAPDVA
ncbi:MAG: DoxX family membrane protein [Acidobacteria bacterium]|nr:DoxX family membrane protein [Acidobacteriota bacterium]